ncbi:MAG: hypothetical protein ABH856_03005 [Patescibacteria group bacterium]|nr:hypothetical protein [Patescibacteria group bacterium]
MEKAKIMRVVQVIGGIFLILLGIVGLVLPFLQGILFIFGGIMLLFPEKGQKIIAEGKKFLKKFFKKFRK